MHVVVVESPAKAKTINKYLGDEYLVLASYGHVRDLPSRDGSVRPDDDFAMTYEVDPRSAKHIAAIADAVKKADRLILATDPDREGEAISWHVLEALALRRKLGDLPVQRVVFNEITRTAVNEAMRHPRAIDMDLVNAQQARRALDYLVGFTLSPVLWRKLPGARSAGRVQSVALRLVCERENEIELFVPEEYWSIEAAFTTEAGENLSARLTHLGPEKLEKFSIADEARARQAVAAIEAARGFRAAHVETRPARRHPQPPFTTSTLQQEASRKLGFGASRTMSLAQRLYEGIDIGGETVGLITYMRTDGVTMADEAVAAARRFIGGEFGSEFVPAERRVYRAKAKNAQEAHECIRPTDAARQPRLLERRLDRDLWRLYELIWKRAIASQMESARLQRTTVDIRDRDGACAFRASGSVVEFPGFLKLYEEGRDDARDDGEDAARLPKLSADAPLARGQVTPAQHFTEPPPRYSEATLVRRLEELGIGRPSTYASILSVLQERNYVRLEKGRFEPEDKGRLVTAFLESYFRRYVEYDFTADLEQRLDEISAGHVDWRQVLRDFWRDFDKAVGATAELRVREVLDAVNELLAPHLYPDQGLARACPRCADGQLSLKGGKYGFFLGCSNYPECRFTRPLGGAGGEEPAAEAELDGPRTLGLDPETGLGVTLRKGPFGLYLQLGEQDDGKPRRASVPKDVALETLDLELALKLLSLPRMLGSHPESGQPIEAGIGRYGPFLRMDGKYARLGGTDEVLSIGLNRAVSLLADAAGKGGRRAGARELRGLGPHPEDGQPIAIFEGRYGPYVKHGKINATLPRGRAPEEVTVEEAVALLSARAAKAPAGRRGRAKAGQAAGPAKAKAAKGTAAKGTAKVAKGKSGGRAKPRGKQPGSARADFG